ncbi:MAG: alkaline phosphatase PhoX [Candidatus Poseidoniaceae archaeon]
MRTKPALTLLSIGLLLALSGSPLVTAQANGETTPELMTRIMMLPPEAEVTGMHIDANGNFFVNAMHPDEDRYKATIGVINGIDWNTLPATVPELDSSSSENDIWHGIRTSYGDYQVILQSGDALSQGGVAGGIYAADDGEQLLVSKKPDYNAFVPLNDDGTRGYLYTAWEDRPAGLSQVELEWNASSSEWIVVSSSMVDLSSINGGWVLCFGSMSPWGSPLFSEELYFDNTQYWNDEGFRYHSDQLRLENYLGFYPNPYDYGYIVELENATTSEPDLTKHLAMGRFSHENAEVMPDEKTVYLTDDGYDTVLFKFVADDVGDLSAGTLYGAKVTQDNSRDSATTGFDVEWMEMAASSNAEIQTWIDDYDGITPDDFITGQNSYISDEEINDWAEGRLNQDLNGDGAIGFALDDRVAFLESRKAAAALGASDEWNKMEGVAFNPNAPEHLYLAMSRIESAMTDGQDDIDVTQNSCGIVYRMTVAEGWNINRIDPVLSGGPYMSTAQYKCDVNNLAGPDNLLVLDDGRILVGEDTYHHESNMVWLWGEKIEASNVDENLTLNHVKLVNAPTGNDSTWTYGYQTEVNDLQIGLTYTAFMTVKEVGDEDLKGFWLWNGIETNGEQYDQTFSLQAGCYSINASLYESDDLNADAKNASLVSYAHSDFVVGNGACTNGEYADGPTEPQEETKEVADVGIPGFGSLLSITAALGALLVTSRRSLRDNHFE